MPQDTSITLLISPLTNEIDTLKGTYDEFSDCVLAVNNVLQSYVDNNDVSNVFSSEIDEVLGAISSDDADLPFQFEDSTNELIADINDNLCAVTEKGSDVSIILEELLAKIVDLQDQLVEVPDIIEEAYVTLSSQLDSSFSEISVVLSSGVEESINNSENTIEVTESALQSFFEENINDSLMSTLGDNEVLIKASLEKSFEHVEGFSELLFDEINNQFSDLKYHVEETAKESLKEAVDEIINMLITQIMSDIQESILMTQVSNQVIVMLQSILPQIIMANAIAPAVQSALDKMRMS